MILSRCDFFGKEDGGKDDFRTRMLLENDIAGLLKVTHRQTDGEGRYYYEINSLQSFDRLYEKNEIGYDELVNILSGCASLFERLEEYLLDGNQIILNPELVYINVDNMKPYFVCYPDYEGDVRYNFMEFVDILLTKIDHTDDRAVKLGYNVYRYTRNPNYVISGLYGIMERDYCEKIVESQELKGAYDDFSKRASEIVIDEKEVRTINIMEDKEKLKSVIICIALLVISCGCMLGGLFGTDGYDRLYFCGIAVVSFVADVLFVYTKLKKGKNALSVEKEPVDMAFDTQPVKYIECKTGELHKDIDAQNETVFLENATTEERVLTGKVDGKEVSISLKVLPLTIGKQSGFADFVINDPTVSKLHARFEELDGKVCVCDLNSTNGTVKNGETIEINRPVAIEPGDRLRFGRTSFIYC
jgi:hypothetical protein